MVCYGFSTKLIEENTLVFTKEYIESPVYDSSTHRLTQKDRSNLDYSDDFSNGSATLIFNKAKN